MDGSTEECYIRGMLDKSQAVKDSSPNSLSVFVVRTSSSCQVPQVSSGDRECGAKVSRLGISLEELGET